jgi:hypothetical protein
MNMKSCFIASFAALCLVFASSARAQDAREIMIKVDDNANQSYTSSMRIVQFSTCRYAIASGKLSCREKPRVIEVESVHRGYPVEGMRDRNNKAFDVIIAPIGDKGTSMLSYGYADQKKDSDFWIYLPALAKVKRVVSVSDSNESGAVFGSELSTEDADVKRIKDYTYKILGSETVRGREAWMVEMTPTAYRRTRSYYSKIVAWVDKERFVVIKEDLYDRTGRRYKQRTALEVKKIENTWVVVRGSMNNLLSKRITLWEERQVKFNVEIDDEFLTQRSLTDFAFRERMMSKYRKLIQ